MHSSHEDHTHNSSCGHTAIHHAGHIDYLHNEHLHNVHMGHIDDHTLEVTANNPALCNTHLCSKHNNSHAHGKNCGHEAIPHGDHLDYIVDGHLHHPHMGHCDHHGSLEK